MRRTMPNRLYVGNLAYLVTNGDLEQLFSGAGRVDSATVITDKFSGESKGFGFVEMANSEEAATAIAQLNNAELKGRNIKVKETRPRESRSDTNNRSGGGGYDSPQILTSFRRIALRRSYSGSVAN
jgi:RNA recognition motif-containing protein